MIGAVRPVLSLLVGIAHAIGLTKGSDGGTVARPACPARAREEGAQQQVAPLRGVVQFPAGERLSPK